jgi:hypothetical protein
MAFQPDHRSLSERLEENGPGQELRRDFMLWLRLFALARRGTMG